MTKKDFIALADAIRDHNLRDPMNNGGPFTYGQLATLGTVMQQINPRFKYTRWMDYIGGNCGPNGGKQ